MKEKGSTCFIIVFPGGSGGNLIGSLLLSLELNKNFKIDPQFGHCHCNPASEYFVDNLSKKKIRFKEKSQVQCVLGHSPKVIPHLKNSLPIIRKEFNTLHFININIYRSDVRKICALNTLKTQPSELKISNLISKKKPLLNKTEYQDQLLWFFDHFDIYKLENMKHDLHSIDNTILSDSNVFFSQLDFKKISTRPNKILKQLSEITGKEITQYERDKYAEYLSINRKLWNRFFPYASFTTGQIHEHI